jgi:L-2-hydroxyglutarate oxidase LhgO
LHRDIKPSNLLLDQQGTVWITDFPFLGVQFTRMIQGGIEAGPNAVLALKREGYDWTNFSLRDVLNMGSYGGFWRMDSRYWKIGLGEFHRSLSKPAFLRALQELLPEFRSAEIHPAGAGVRAQALTPAGALVDDFHIEVVAPSLAAAMRKMNNCLSQAMSLLGLPQLE